MMLCLLTAPSLCALLLLLGNHQRPRYSSAYRARRNAMKALVAECSESMMDDVQRNAWLFVDRAQLR